MDIGKKRFILLKLIFKLFYAINLLVNFHNLEYHCVYYDNSIIYSVLKLCICHCSFIHLLLLCLFISRNLLRGFYSICIWLIRLTPPHPFTPFSPQVSLQRGLLLPGETAEVILSVLVDKRTSQLLNIGLAVHL